MALANEVGQLGTFTIPSAEGTRTGERSKSSVAYEEKKRIPIPETFGAGRECYAIAYQAVTAESFSYDPAWLCFSCNKGKKPRTCFDARSKAWVYQFVQDLAIVPIISEASPPQGVLFIAKFSGGGSGWSRLITLWVYRKECRSFVNILPEIVIGKRDAFKLLGDQDIKPGGVFVVAESWPTAEQSVLEPRKYRIKIYRYSPEDKIFKPLSGGQFLTDKTYWFEGDWFGLEPTTEVIDDNMRKIRSLINRN